MKRVWIATSALIIIVALCITETIFINSTTKKFTELLQENKDYVIDDDIESAKEVSLELKEKWSKSHKKLALFITHDRLEEINFSIAIMNSTLDFEDDICEFFFENEKLNSQFKNLNNTETPTIDNIL